MIGLTEALTQVVKGRHYRYNNEAQLHQGLAEAFEAHGIGFEREVRIKGGRIDFLVTVPDPYAVIGVEVKVKGSAGPLIRQVTRYAAEPRLDAILVVTTNPRHRAAIGFAEGKPIDVVTIGAFSL